MDATPRRLRRIRSDPPSGPAVSKRRRTGLLPPDEVLKGLLSAESSGAKASSACSSSSELLAASEGTAPAPPPSTSGAAAEGSPSATDDRAGEASGLLVAVDDDEAAPETGRAEVASLVVTRADQGGLEFQLDGKVYGVRDASAFAGAVAAGPRTPRRSPAELHRLQRERREREAKSSASRAQPAVWAPWEQAFSPAASEPGAVKRDALARALQAAAGAPVLPLVLQDAPRLPLLEPLRGTAA
uniref:Uncharacterized protein n=1 Tax=Alexandrium catenella TaxID=2925 RepID=A0A7S1RDS9_ALECA